MIPLAANSMAARARPVVYAACMLWLVGCSTPGVQEGIPELDLGSSVTPLDLPIIIAPARAPIVPNVINHGPRNAQRVALTFDGCSLNATSYYDERVTKVLLDMHVPATIFLGGKWMQDHPEHLRYLASLPQFELAAHGFLHAHMTKISDERVREELRWTQDTMYALIGKQATLFRAPYGEVNERLATLVGEAGLTTVQFDLPSGDADKKIRKKKLVEYVSTKTKPGSIVVMHINRRGWKTHEALPEIITNLRKRGFEFVTVSELLNLTPPPAPAAPVSDIVDAGAAVDANKPGAAEESN